MILVLDFGSQYTQLIARRVRESNVYCEIHPFNTPLEKIRQLQPKGIILSGGPAVSTRKAPPRCRRAIRFSRSLLGICYGMGLINRAGGGEVVQAQQREYGLADLLIIDNSDLFYGFSQDTGVPVWMSHGDHMTSLPHGWCILAQSANSPIAAFSNPERRLFGVQFHPEVTHSLGKGNAEKFSLPHLPLRTLMDHGALYRDLS